MIKRILAAAGEEPSSVNAAASALATLDPCTEVDVFHLNQKRPSDVLDELLHRALETRADVLVLGARKHLIASRAAMLAPCSVLMVPEGAALAFDRLLVPVDFSLSSAAALQFAGHIAAAQRGELAALAVECDEDPWLEWGDDHDKIARKLREFCDESLASRREVRYLTEPLHRSAVTLQNGVFSIAHRIEGADVASTIIGVAKREHSSMIVMGTRGRTKSASVLLGSVTEHVMQRAACPVLAVKRPGVQLGLAQAILTRLKSDEPVMVAS